MLQDQNGVKMSCHLPLELTLWNEHESESLLPYLNGKHSLVKLRA